MKQSLSQSSTRTQYALAALFFAILSLGKMEAAPFTFNISINITQGPDTGQMGLGTITTNGHPIPVAININVLGFELSLADTVKTPDFSKFPGLPAVFAASGSQPYVYISAEWGSIMTAYPQSWAAAGPFFLFSDGGNSYFHNPLPGSFTFAFTPLGFVHPNGGLFADPGVPVDYGFYSLTDVPEPSGASSLLMGLFILAGNIAHVRNRGCASCARR